MPLKIMTLTDAASERINEIIEDSDKPVIGVRVGIKNAGCAGQAYTLDYVSEPVAGDDHVEDKGVNVYVEPKATLFLGKCGGLKKRNNIGDLILPIAAIRGEGTSNDYFPPEVPALPAFALQKAVSTTIRDYSVDYWTGTVYTTNRRVWEHDDHFKEYLQKIRAMAIDMETATIFSVGFYNKIPTGALLLVSDQPMVPEGVKTEESDKKVTANFVERHVRIGIDSLKQLINDGLTVRHLRF